MPRTAREIDLSPTRQDAGRNPERNLSRQAVEGHLEQLEEIGFVHARPGKREGREVLEYVLNQARLFVVVDELRRISLMRSALGDAQETAAGPGPHEGRVALPPGPALVLANGPFEGKVFALEGPGPWAIGREKEVDVSLAYDPFVSRENSRIHKAREGIVIEAMASTRNGTRVNWIALGDGERRLLAPGDAIGVGRSLLFLRGG